MAIPLEIGFSSRRGFMSDNDQKIEYVNALEESQKLDDSLASISLRLSKIGASLKEVGVTLEGKGSRPLDWLSRNFAKDSFEKDCANVPDLLEQYKTAIAKRTELEERLQKFSWHKRS
jgi:hypothetical protein